MQLIKSHLELNNCMECSLLVLYHFEIYLNVANLTFSKLNHFVL